MWSRVPLLCQPRRSGLRAGMSAMSERITRGNVGCVGAGSARVSQLYQRETVWEWLKGYSEFR